MQPSSTVQRDRMVGVGGGGIVAGIGDQGAEVDGVGLQRPALVEPGQQQQVLDQAAHADRLLLGAGHGRGPGLGVLEPAPAVELGVAPDGGDRRPQLVGGVGHEPPQPVLGRGAGGEGVLDVGQHRVEGDAQLAGLGAGIGLGHPLREVAGPDGRGRGRHPLDRPHPEAEHPQGDQRQQGEDQGRGADLDGDELGHRLVDVVEGGADEQQRPAGQSRAKTRKRSAPLPPTVWNRPDRMASIWASVQVGTIRSPSTAAGAS